MPSQATLSFDSINSINPLTGYTTASNHETVQVLGYYTPADGGGGEFYWDPTSTAIADGGSVIATSLTTGRWIRIFSTFQISVKAFGAVGNNSTDDHVAIQNASNYCQTLIPASPTLYFPSAKGYNINNNTITVKPYISVWMDSFLNLNNTTFDKPCLQIGELGIVNGTLNCRIMVNNKIYSPWGNYTNCIGVKFINLTSSNIKIDTATGFTIGCQLFSDIACEYNNFYLTSLIDNQRAIDFATSGAGFVNENVFIGGNFSASSNLSKAPWNTQSRWGIYAATTGSMNQNVFYKPCFQLGAYALVNITSINTLNNLTPGSGYTDGTYSNVLLTGGSGSGAIATVTISAGGITTVQLTSYGIGYAVGDTLSASLAGGSGFSTSVAALATDASGISNFTFSPGTGYTNGTYYNVSLTGGTGNGARATITIEGGKISTVQFTIIGIGYTIGDILSATFIGGTASNFLTVTTLSVSPTAINNFTFTAGSGYPNGTYSNIPLTGGTGTGAKATISVAGGIIYAIQITSTGIGYAIGDSLSATFGGATATNFFTVISLTISPTSISAFSLSNVGSLYTSGTYANVLLTGGSGSGAKATITISAGSITSVQLLAIGIGYVVGDILTAPATSIGGTGSGFNITITNLLSGGAMAIPVYLDSALFFSFNNCRVESCSTTIVQARNRAAGNSFSIDYYNGLTLSDPTLTIDDSTSARDTVVNFNCIPESNAANTLIYSSPLLVNALSPYGPNLYNIKGLDWVRRTDGAVINGSTLTFIGPDYIELSSADACFPSVTINTMATKRFLVKFDTVSNGPSFPGFGGRFFINCYDVSGNIIDPSLLGNPILWTNFGARPFGANSTPPSVLYGKGYNLLSDLRPYFVPQFYFSVDISVAKVRLIFAFGTQNLKLRQFSIYSLDNRSESAYSSSHQTEDFLGLASSMPNTANPKGTYVKNDFSNDTKSQFWYNTNGLPSGWKTSNDFNNLINSPILSGAGTPNGIVSAPVGSLYLNTSGSTGTTLYVKETGVGNTGWVAK